MVTEWNQR